MDLEKYVTELYVHVLGRSPDPEGLENCCSLARETGDPTMVLMHLIESAEYEMRNALPATADESVWREALDLIGGRRLTIVDVGAQVLSFEDHVYAPLLRPEIPHHVIGFEPLAEKLEQRSSQEKGRLLTLYPYAIGDGGTHTLHINNDDATSSLFPLNRPFVDQFEHLNSLHEVEQLTVKTHRLDDVLPDEAIDFLKLDIQGAELLALQGAERTLSRTAVVHCEVELSPIYEGQSLLPDIQKHMNERGFSLVDLIIPHRYAYLNDAGIDSRDRLLWADAVFLRESDDPSRLAAQAVIGALIYEKKSMAQHFLERARNGGPRA